MNAQNAETNGFEMLPEMVDVISCLPEMAKEKDLRGFVAEARQQEKLRNGVPQARSDAKVSDPPWPLEPGSLAEAVYWYRPLIGHGAYSELGEVVNALCNLAFWWRDEQRWTEAELAFRECMQFYRRQNNLGGVRQAWFDLGGVYEAQARWTDAELAFAEALRIARETPDRHSHIYTLYRLGLVCATLGKSREAVDYLQQAVTLAHEVADRKLEKRMKHALTRVSER